MSKAVKLGEEVGVGKQIGGQKRHRSEEENPQKKKRRGDGDTVDKSVSDGAESHGVATTKEGVLRHPYPCLCYPEKELMKERAEGCQDPLSSWENVGLRRMFSDWANKHGKTYKRETEKKLRFKIWCATKKIIEQHCSNTGQPFSIKKMTTFSDKTGVERMKMHGSLPDKVPLKVLKRNLLDTLGKRRKEKAWKEFDEWAERHIRDYGSRRERKKRFLAYLDNKRRIDLLEKGYPRDVNDLDTMDKFGWEASLFPQAGPCSRCSYRSGPSSPSPSPSSSFSSSSSSSSSSSRSHSSTRSHSRTHSRSHSHSHSRTCTRY